MTKPETSAAMRNAVVAMYAGLALTVVAAVVTALGGDAVSKHVFELEAPYVGAEVAAGSGSFMVIYLLALYAVGVVCWLGLSWAARAGRRWVRPVAIVVLLGAAGLAALNLTVEEYGTRVLPLPVALAGLLPCAAGVVAVVFLWRARVR
ncbi:hypothetical protein [Saccharopolyspora taberi]|uniref:Uncharacterized protein n=1 Tax=Saccharopolyspora taberi TaxID=60895 RepID=A0ABN3VHJ1_9PSEU